MLSSTDILNASILIVDDQESDVLLLEQMLKNAGYTRIMSTMDPHAVNNFHREHHFDLILLDLQMPGMDGFQVMENLNEVETDGYLPVLAITAQPAHKLRALKGGAKDFVSKPFDLSEVLMRVHNMLEVRLLHEAARNHSKTLELLALNDPLTGLANRRLLADRMSMALVHARRNESFMAVVYLDLDGFKQINDTLGHGAGDLMLKMVADRLLETVREEDTVARLGGDEFIIALWNVSGSDYAARAASRAIEAVSKPYDIEGTIVHLTTSAGVSIYPDHGEDAETLIKCADLALYEAKHAGKNVYRISECSDQTAIAHICTNIPAVSIPVPEPTINAIPFFDKPQHSATELYQAYDATIEGWSRALELRDNETEGHTQRVAVLTVKLAHLFGLSDEELVQVRWGVLLHDIGKMAIPDGILLKNNALTEEEWVVMKKHTVLAYEMLSPIKYLRSALDIPYAHHEKWDGSGYPLGLKGEEIPLVARIFAVVDVWDALRTDRLYRTSWSVKKVRKHLLSLAGTHFDPRIVKVCLDSDILMS